MAYKSKILKCLLVVLALDAVKAQPPYPASKTSASSETGSKIDLGRVWPRSVPQTAFVNAQPITSRYADGLDDTKAQRVNNEEPRRIRNINATVPAQYTEHYLNQAANPTGQNQTTGPLPVQVVPQATPCPETGYPQQNNRAYYPQQVFQQPQQPVQQANPAPCPETGYPQQNRGYYPQQMVQAQQQSPVYPSANNYPAPANNLLDSPAMRSAIETELNNLIKCMAAQRAAMSAPMATEPPPTSAPVQTPQVQLPTVVAQQQPQFYSAPVQQQQQQQQQPMQQTYANVPTSIQMPPNIPDCNSYNIALNNLLSAQQQASPNDQSVNVPRLTVPNYYGSLPSLPSLSSHAPTYNYPASYQNPQYTYNAGAPCKRSPQNNAAQVNPALDLASSITNVATAGAASGGQVGPDQVLSGIDKIWNSASNLANNGQQQQQLPSSPFSLNNAQGNNPLVAASNPLFRSGTNLGQAITNVATDQQPMTADRVLDATRTIWDASANLYNNAGGSQLNQAGNAAARMSNNLANSALSYNPLNPLRSLNQLVQGQQNLQQLMNRQVMDLINLNLQRQGLLASNITPVGSVPQAALGLASSITNTALNPMQNRQLVGYAKRSAKRSTKA